MERFVDEEVALAFKNFRFESEWVSFCESVKRREESAAKLAAWEALSRMPPDALKEILELKKFDFKPERTDFDSLQMAGLIELSRSRERYYSRLWIGAFAFAFVVYVINLLMGDPIRNLLGFFVVVVVLVFVTDWLNRKADKTTDVTGEISWTKEGLIFAEHDLFPELNRYLREKKF